ncbi:MAG TPA: hypothetical protein VE999_14885 [Gemmataceae bacterium]|nr:hypothetical protein [Gemmataceae bacterium]
MRRIPMNRPRRRAIASLELVLVFPFLLSIVSALFLIARADVVKVRTATDARRQTWRNRPNAPSGQLLQPWHNPQDSEISSLPQRSVTGGPPFSGQTFQAQSRNALIANPWASQAIPFPSLDQNLKPHTSVLSLLGTQLAGASFDALSAALDPGTNPALVAASATGISIGNPGILVAGAYLRFTVGAALDAAVDTLNAMWEALEVATLGFAGDTDEGKKIQKALNELTEFLNCFDNLWDAANGRLGADPYDN